MPGAATVLLAFCALLAAVSAFDINAFTNVVAYWGQNSNGGLHPNDPNASQKRLSFYCGDDSPVDIFPLAFLNTFFAKGGMPSLDLTNICSNYNHPTFNGTSIPDCGFLAPDIQQCQAKGKILVLSLGGATASTTFQDDGQAEEFAQLLWDMFLGGTHAIRPFGKAVLDGLDLDLEGGGVRGDVAFVNKIRALADKDKSKRYYITAAPQCPYPDVNLQSTLNQAWFDAVFVQHYNNYCSLPKFNTTSFNFGVWDVWANTISPNKDIKVYLGAPGSPDSAGTGYVAIDELKEIATSLRFDFPNFGGVMFWDMSTSYANGRMDREIKNELMKDGANGFTYPACDQPAYNKGQSYDKGSKVVHQGYIWQANYWVQSAPTIDPPNDQWVPISACGTGTIGGGSPTKPPTGHSTSSKPRPTSKCADCSTPLNPGLAPPKVRTGHCVVRPSRRNEL